MLCLPDAWVWDSWFADDGVRFHAFYLKASRALLDPERRHHRASVGHAVSDDLVTWTELPDALVAGDAPAFDDLAIWTGSILTVGGVHHLFYTGIDRTLTGRIQAVGHATSRDLVTWERTSAEPVLRADPRWYRTFDVDGQENFRDPWVLWDPSDGCWRMIVTAETADGVPEWRGCVATAVSDDLATWTMQPPLAFGGGFHQHEVTQIVATPDGAVLVWCMRDIDAGPDSCSPADGGPAITGTWTAPGDSVTGPFHLDRAEPIRVEGTYAGRIVTDRDGGLRLMAFIDVAADGSFGGCLGDPVPLQVTARGTLQPSVADATAVIRGMAVAV